MPVRCNCGNFRIKKVDKLKIVDFDGNVVGILSIYYCPVCKSTIGREKKIEN